jgi:hypothetical protein
VHELENERVQFGEREADCEIVELKVGGEEGLEA